MRKLRIAVIIIFIGAAALFAAYQVRTRIEADTEPPVITSDSDSVSVSVEGEESDVFQGLSAEDNVDGDITDDIRVASMSNFTDTGVDGDITDDIRVASMSNFTDTGTRNITYVVFDSSNQAATLTRELVYSDYTPPRITLTEPLRFSLNETEEWETSDFLQLFQATDCLDGDITSQIRMNIEGNGYIDGAGTYPITLQVNNSAGDVTSVPVEMTIVDPEDEQESEKYYPVLSQYIVYTKAGQSLSLGDYVTGIQRGSMVYEFDSPDMPEELTGTEVTITDGTDYNTPGTYTAEFSYTPPEGVTATTKMTVVVEE